MIINYSFLYKDGIQYAIEIDPDKKDIRLSFGKAGNINRYNINLMGLDLISDRLKVTGSKLLQDGEGDFLPIDLSNSQYEFWDEEWFTQTFNYMAQGGILGFSGICLDVVFKNILQDTRVFKADGIFVKPIYCEVSSVVPSNDPDFNNGSLTATVVQTNGYIDIQVRYRKDAGVWSPWTPITTPIIVNNLGLGIYDIEFRSLGTDLIIKPEFQIVF